MKWDNTTKENAIYHLENAIYELDGIVDNRIIHLVAKLKNVLVALKRCL